MALCKYAELNIWQAVAVYNDTAQKCVQHWLNSIYSLWATVAPHAPPGGFSETTIFMNLIHIAIGTRVPAKILMLDKAVRALFFKMAAKML